LVEAEAALKDERLATKQAADMQLAAESDLSVVKDISRSSLQDCRWLKTRMEELNAERKTLEDEQARKEVVEKQLESFMLRCGQLEAENATLRKELDTNSPKPLASSYRSSNGFQLNQAPALQEAVPLAVAALDTNQDGNPDTLVTGVDRNCDDVPDVLQALDAILAATTTATARESMLLAAARQSVSARCEPRASTLVTSVDGQAIPVPMASAVVTGVDANRDGVPDVLQSGQAAESDLVAMIAGTARQSVAASQASVAARSEPTASAIVTGVDMNRDGIPDVVQGGQAAGSDLATIIAGAARQSVAAARASVAARSEPTASAIVTGVDMNRDGIPDVVQGGQAAELDLAAIIAGAARQSVAAARASVAARSEPTASAIVTGVDMNRDGIPDVVQGGQAAELDLAAIIAGAARQSVAAARASVVARSDSKASGQTLETILKVAENDLAATITAAVRQSVAAARKTMITEVEPVASAVVTGADANRDGIPDVLQSRQAARPFASFSIAAERESLAAKRDTQRNLDHDRIKDLQREMELVHSDTVAECTRASIRKSMLARLQNDRGSIWSVYE
jgi:hypothetical protein